MSEPEKRPSPAQPAWDPEHTPGWVFGILAQRCPRCRTGEMFRDSFTMNDPCPVCGLIFQREEGYFLGSMYTSYGLAVALLGTFYLIAKALLPNWSSLAVAVVALLPFLPLIPAVFRYSRVLWIYLDRAAAPGDVSAGAYEKLRQKQLAQRKDASHRGAGDGR
jgi:uncharacterized protein (DUF983 family)